MTADTAVELVLDDFNPRKSRDPQPGIAARDAYDCPLCPEPIEKGDRIAFLRGRPTHCACVMEVGE